MIHLGLFAHRKYLARQGTPQTVEDLADHDVIGPNRSQADLKLAEQVMPNVPPQHFLLQTDSHPAQFAAVTAGMGIAAVQVAKRNPSLVRVLPDLQVGVLETWVVTHEDLRDVARVRAVIDHLAEIFKG